MKTSSLNNILFVLSIAFSGLYYIIYNWGSVFGQFCTLMSLFFLVLLYALLNKTKTLVLLFFLISFFTYLLGRDFFVFLLRNYVIEIDELFVLNDTSQSIKFVALYLSLLCIFWGNYIFKDVFRVTYIKGSIDRYNKMIAIRRFSLMIFWTSMLFKMIYIVVEGHNIMTNSYANIDTTSNMPHFMVLLSFLNTVSYVIYINTYPPKQEMLRPLFCFVVLTLSSISMGERGSVMYTLFFLLIYLMYRDSGLPVDKRFIGKKGWRFLFLSAPFVLIGLNLFAFVRSSEDIQSRGFLMDIVGFFLQQGGSSNLIYLVDEYRYSLPDTNISYSLGPFINYFRDLFGLSPEIGWDSFTYNALYGNNLGATLTYITNPSYYYSGGGLGTQYIAELIADFGYIGVILYSFLLGIFLRYVSFDVKKNFLGQVFSSFIIIFLLAVPRDFCFSWVITLLSPAYLLAICIVYYGGITYYNRKYNALRAPSEN